MQAFRKAIGLASVISVILIVGITPHASVNAHDFITAKICGSTKVISIEYITCVEPQMKVGE
jgi:hypothetical protein